MSRGGNSVVCALSAVLSACSGPGSTSDNAPAKDGVTDSTPPPDTGAPGAPEGLCSAVIECVGGIPDEPKSPCVLTLTRSDGTVDYDGAIGMERRGRSTLWLDKGHYGIELRDYSGISLWPGAADWAYFDAGTEPGAGWQTAVYDDSGWARGDAPLGYGVNYVNTTHAAPITTYYRIPFDAWSLDRVTQAELGALIQDGAVIYLNGQEVARKNVPMGAGPNTLATEEAYGLVDFDFDAALLNEQDNLLAIEIHQRSATSKEMGFDAFVTTAGDDRPTPLLGMGREDDWILNGQYLDRSLIRNRLAYDLYQSFDGANDYAADIRFCELELDGEPRGIYSLGERLDRDDDRIDIAPGKNPGDSFIVKLGDAVGFHDNATGYGTWEQVYPDPEPVSTAAIDAWFDAFDAAVLGPDPANPDTGVFSLLDLDSTVDWVLINEFMGNHDGYLLSIHIWRDQGGKGHFSPWDFDLSMGYPYTDCDAIGWNPRHGNVLIEAISEVPEFRAALQARWEELRAGPLDREVILALVEHYDGVLAPGLEENLALWPIADIAFSFDGVDNWLCPVGSYDQEHKRILDYIDARLAWMDANVSTF